MCSDSLEKCVEVGARELPLERRSDLLVVVLEAEQAVFHSSKVGSHS